MAIPDYQTIMLPLLRFAGDRQEHSFRQAIDTLAEHFGLSETERRELLPSGKQPIFDYRAAWSKTYLGKAGLLESTKIGHFQISSRGLSVLEQNPPRIDNQFLNQFEEFRAFRRRKKKDTERNGQDQVETQVQEELTPGEALESAYQQLRDGLADDLLEKVKTSPPGLFEKLVVELLLKMGYGGTRKDAGRAIGRSGDEGIDGTIDEDRLGLDTIYLQAKRWENTVGRPEIQRFAGALQGQRAKKGVFITTSNFSKEARDYASRIETKIVLIDGDRLTQLMIDHNVAVNVESTYEVKRIDTDYFADE